MATKVITITDSREIPARGLPLLSADWIETEAQAKAWAESEGILTVYWYEALRGAFGYQGK